jgi:hypothetical protein
LAVGGLGWFFTRGAPAPAPVVEAPATPAPDATTTAATMAACTKTFTLGVKDGDTVTEGFRFGGEGADKGYEVTVTRLDKDPRVIGTKLLPLDSACAYGYDSKPGKGKIKYDIRPYGADVATPATQSLTLTVN